MCIGIVKLILCTAEGTFLKKIEWKIHKNNWNDY